MRKEQVNFKLQTGDVAEIVNVDKLVIDITKIEELDLGEDSNIVGRVGFEVGEVNLFVSIFDQGEYLQGRFPWYSIGFRDLDDKFERDLKDSITGIAVDAWKLYNLSYEPQQYQKYENRGCSNCRYKERITFDSDEYNTRLYCQIKKTLIDKGKQKVKQELQKDKSTWLMKEQGILVTNPNWSADSSLQATYNNLLDSGVLNCRYHRYAFFTEDNGWFFQSLYSGHSNWNLADLEVGTPKITYKLRCLNPNKETLCKIVARYNKTVNAPNNSIKLKETTVKRVASILKMEAKKGMKALKQIAKITGVKKGKLVELLKNIANENTDSAPTEENDRYSELKELCEKAGIPVVEGETPFHTIIRESSSLEELKDFVYNGIQELEGKDEMKDKIYEETKKLYVQQ